MRMKPLRVDRGDVAGAQPAVVELLRRRSGPRSSRRRSRGRAPRARRCVSPSQGTSLPSSPISRASTSGTSGPARCGSATRPRPRRRRAGCATAPTGLVSVMPQAWTIRTPWRSSKPRISDSGTAAPPQIIVRSAREVGLVLVGVAQHVEPDRRHARPRTSPARTRSACASGSACRKRPGITRSAPHERAAYGKPQAFTWNIGTTGSTRSRGRDPDRRRPCTVARQCRMFERCEYRTPFGLPVVPLV